MKRKKRKRVDMRRMTKNTKSEKRGIRQWNKEKGIRETRGKKQKKNV